MQIPESTVTRVYEQLKRMLANFHFKPGERVNEVEVATQLGVSRTPLREALNRLSTEGFLTMEAGKGFFCRLLDPQEIFDLYEVRKAIEVGAIRLSVQRRTDEQVAALIAFLEENGPEAGERTRLELLELDETFHEMLAKISDNDEMLRLLKNVNARIRFVRWIDLDAQRRLGTQAEHRRIALALRDRDADLCVEILEKHIDRRLDQITAAIQVGYGHIYMTGSLDALP